MRIIEEYLPHELLTTENFTLQEINQINIKLKAIKLTSFSNLWEYKALIAEEWQFFEDYWHIVNASGLQIIHYVLLNGNETFIQRALEKLGPIAFQMKESLENLLISCIKSGKLSVLKWIEEHCLTTLGALEKNQAISLLDTAWRHDCLPVVDFCHKYFKQYVHNMEKDQYKHVSIHSKDPEVMVYRSLIKTKGWDKAFNLRQTAWKDYLQEKVSIKDAVNITKDIWQHGTKDSLHFCYTHFKEQLYTKNIAGEIIPRLDEGWIKRTVMRGQNDKEMITEAFFKSTVPHKVDCYSLEDLPVVSLLLDKYLLLRECVYSGDLSDLSKRKPNTASNALFSEIETNIERNQKIHTLYSAFKKIVYCHMLLKEAYLPEIALEISLAMLDSYKIRPTFGFFKNYEEQLLRWEQNMPAQVNYGCSV